MSKFKVFNSVPEYGRKRIFGTENEYGITDGNSKFGSWLSNGGLVYWDCDHPEYASPETSNPLEAVIFSKAGETIVQDYGRKLYKNNTDNDGKSFGSHENYFTFASFKKLEEMIPFLTTRQIFAGAGNYFRNGDFTITQRVKHVYRERGGNTTDDRGILNKREEPLSYVPDWHRLHLILGDANMCEVAEFLKLGTTGLVIDLVEDKKMPEIETTGGYVNVLHHINDRSKKWMYSFNLSAIDVQRTYLDAAVDAYLGRDEITDEILARWDDVLTKLDQDPMQLVGTLDWVTKKTLLDQYQQAHNLPDGHDFLRNINLQYHDVDKETSLFYALQKAGKIERITTDELIEKAVFEPPSDTRAYARGMVAKRKKSIFTNRSISWGFLNIRFKFSFLKGRSIAIDDPFENYESKIPGFMKKRRSKS